MNPSNRAASVKASPKVVARPSSRQGAELLAQLGADGAQNFLHQSGEHIDTDLVSSYFVQYFAGLLDAKAGTYGGGQIQDTPGGFIDGDGDPVLEKFGDANALSELEMLSVVYLVTLDSNMFGRDLGTVLPFHDRVLERLWGMYRDRSTARRSLIATLMYHLGPREFRDECQPFVFEDVSHYMNVMASYFSDLMEG